MISVSRRAAHHHVSRRLAAMSDTGIGTLLAEAEPLGTGIGGSTMRTDVDGVPLFVKLIRLTDVERRAGDGHTGNLFGLPPYCQYGVGSPGFNAWREPAAHDAATRWALAGETVGVPLTYHHRVVPFVGPAAKPENGPFDGHPAVAARIAALAAATHCVALFTEHLPETAVGWLAGRRDDQLPDAYRSLWTQLTDTVTSFGRHGLHHSDAHLGNVLTDGTRVYLTDFGLAQSTDFALDAEEVAFHGRHRHYDTDEVTTAVLVSLMRRLHGDVTGPLKGYAAGKPPADAPEWARGFVAPHAATALRVLRFVEAVVTAPTTPYPRP
ncbi:phosphotransferase family enzyme [Stackebrandtia albiflava]|uniref:Phosphotransferase family enzyme n=1 Tax=Stackebrandtia albiflava TaxID=406432 RepID=A0A562V9G9_9ACTN|nr:phosphotransferase [Stackebrandtia albiflava]TWJ14488.1 phosphotransferase family enzyme [Stackebrandtia albiflava]